MTQAGYAAALTFVAAACHSPGGLEVSPTGAAPSAVRADGAPSPIGPYSQGIVAGGFLFAAGQIGLDPETGALAGVDAGSQTERALENLRAVLRAAGSDLRDVVKTTVYLSDLADFDVMNAAYARAFPAVEAGSTGPPPARSTIGVAALPKGARVEIDAVARVP